MPYPQFEKMALNIFFECFNWLPASNHCRPMKRLKKWGAIISNFDMMDGIDFMNF